MNQFLTTSKSLPRNDTVTSGAEQSKLSTLGFALLIIVSIGGMVFGSLVLARVGALSQLTQIQALIAEIAGFAGGALCIIGAVVGLVKCRSSKASEQQKPKIQVKINTQTLPKYLCSKEGFIGDYHLMYYLDTQKPENANDILKWSFENRKIPTRGGGFDTVNLTNIQYVGEQWLSPTADHEGYALSPSNHKVHDAICIPDKEIIAITPCSEVKKLEDSDSSSSVLYAGITVDGKHIIQQPATRSCVPTAIAMLLLDKGVSVKTERLFYTNLSTIESENLFLKGYDYKATSVKIDKISDLEKALKEHGSLLFSTSVIGNHQMIVDAANCKKKQVSVRDPFHGWSVTVSLDYFWNTLSDGSYHYLEKT